MTVHEVRARIERLPRMRFANLPTPLEEASNLSRLLGGPRILLKRDDLTGLALGGGNKTRKLEFHLGSAVARRADCIVTGAGAQSNHCREAAAAAHKLGMEAYLVVRQSQDPEVQGNLLLMHLLGAHIEQRPLPFGDTSGMHEALAGVAARLESLGRRPHLIDQYAGDPRCAGEGAIAYVECAMELAEQWQVLGIVPSHLFVASQSGTHAGLALGFTLLGLPTRVVGITPTPQGTQIRKAVTQISADAAAMLDVPCRIDPNDLISEGGYAGPAYGALTEAGLEALGLVGRTEGVLLDPIYSSKAMAALLDYVRRGSVAKADTLVFLHTGGVPAVFAQARELLSRIPSRPI
jgi:1-aminocyclopropane-1-carboxylate deaminase/D-cysteine desulfhydrase-like pyridoxal-dependent ACC family enzyme